MKAVKQQVHHTKHTAMSRYLSDTRRLTVEVQTVAHEEFRKKLMNYNMPVKFAIEEFIIRYVNGDKKAVGIIEDLVADLAQEQSNAHKRNAMGLSMDEIDHNVMYELISRSKDKK